MAPSPPAPRPVPSRSELLAIDVDGFVRRLDDSVKAIANESALTTLLAPQDIEAILSDPRFAQADALFRATLRGSLIATSLHDLPPEAHSHPEVQRRLWSAMDEMDAAVTGMGEALSALTEEELLDIGRAMRQEPEIGEQVLDALDAEAVAAGVSEERRQALRKMGKHACFRLRLSTVGFALEQSEKLKKARPLDVAEAERLLAAQLGEPVFRQEKEWHSAVAVAWEAILAEQGVRLAEPPESGGSGGVSADDAYAPPAGNAPPPAAPSNPNSGKTVLKVGAWLFGLGMFSGVSGALLLQARGGGAVVAGLVSLTAAAVLSVAGLICLLIGAILRVRARSRSVYTLDGG